MSEPCVCLTSDCDLHNDFYSGDTRKARKPHKCCECGCQIKVGQIYHHAVGKSDGDIWAYDTCSLCDEIRTHFYCDDWLFTNLWDDMVEQLFDGGGFRFECMEGLGVPARELILAQWRSWKGL